MYPCGSPTPSLSSEQVFSLAELLPINFSVSIVCHCLQSFISIVLLSCRCSPNHHGFESLALLAFAELQRCLRWRTPARSLFPSLSLTDKVHKSLHGRRLLLEECCVSVWLSRVKCIMNVGCHTAQLCSYLDYVMAFVSKLDCCVVPHLHL